MSNLGGNSKSEDTDKSNNLKGDKGDPGIQGIQGEKGDKGDEAEIANVIGSDTVVNILAKTAAAVGEGWIATDTGVDSNGTPVLVGDLLRASDTAVPSNWVTLGVVKGEDGADGADGLNGTNAIVAVRNISVDNTDPDAAILGMDNVYIAAYVNTVYTNSLTLFTYVTGLAFELPVGLSGSTVYAESTATAAATVDILKNGVVIGTCDFAIATNAATFTFTTLTSFAVGDRLTCRAQASADATLGDVSFTFAGALI